MPLYEYECRQCGTRKEVRHAMDEVRAVRCPRGCIINALWPEFMEKVEISRPGYRRDHTVLNNGG